MDESRVPECPACGFPVWDFEPGKSSVVRVGMLWHPDCAPVSQPTHISETIEDVLERADTSEEIREDATGWSETPEPEDEGFRMVYTDEMIDQMEQEQNERAITERPFRKPLSQNDALLIELVTKRYIGRDAPFVKVETETEVILRIPPHIRRKSYEQIDPAA